MRAFAACLCLLVGVTSSAAADTLFASALLTSTASAPLLDCLITNLGTRSATVTSAAFADPDTGAVTPAGANTCTTAPLAPNHTCSFSVTLAGNAGIALAHVRGSTKSLRGRCVLLKTGVFTDSEDMR
jgi:hypothetical protein